jgi:hypothetical protein
VAFILCSVPVSQMCTSMAGAKEFVIRRCSQQAAGSSGNSGAGAGQSLGAREAGVETAGAEAAEKLLGRNRHSLLLLLSGVLV